MASLAINYWAVLVSGVVALVIGGLWYSPILCGNAWMKCVGKSAEQVQKEFTPLQLVAAFVCGAVVGCTLSIVTGWAEANTFLSGAGVGLMLGVGLLTTMNGVNYFFEHRPIKLFLMNNAHDLLFCAVIGGMVGVWR
jgi:hypothetical protein